MKEHFLLESRERRIQHLLSCVQGEVEADVLEAAVSGRDSSASGRRLAQRARVAERICLINETALIVGQTTPEICATYLQVSSNLYDEDLNFWRGVSVQRRARLLESFGDLLLRIPEGLEQRYLAACYSNGGGA